MVHRVLNNISWWFVGSGLTALLTLAIQAWMVRHFGPEEYGLYAFAINVTLLLGSVAVLGLPAILVRELVRREHEQHVILGSGLLLRVGGATSAWLLGAVAMLLWYADEPRTQRYVLIAATVLFPQALLLIEVWFNARIESRFVVISRMLASLLAFAARVILLTTDGSLITFIWVTVAQSSLESGLMFWFYAKRQQHTDGWRVSRGEMSNLFRASWPVAVSGLTAGMFVRFDQMMLEALDGKLAVGIYSAALLLVEGPNFIPTVICTSVFPALVGLRSLNTRLYPTRIQQFHDLVFWTGLALTLITLFVGPVFVDAVYGPAYAQSKTLFHVLPWYLLLVSVTMAQAQHLMSENMQWLIGLSRGVGCVLNIVLNWLWIPRYGPIGAAWASLISYFVITLVIPGLFPASRRSVLHLLIAVFVPVRYAPQAWQWIRSNARR